MDPGNGAVNDRMFPDLCASYYLVIRFPAPVNPLSTAKISAGVMHIERRYTHPFRIIGQGIRILTVFLFGQVRTEVHVPMGESNGRRVSATFWHAGYATRHQLGVFCWH